MADFPDAEMTKAYAAFGPFDTQNIVRPEQELKDEHTVSFGG